MSSWNLGSSIVSVKPGDGFLDRRHLAKHAQLTRLCSELRSGSSPRRRGLSHAVIPMNVLREAVASPSSRTLNMGSHLTGASESSDLGIRSSNVGERHRTRLPEGA